MTYKNVLFKIIDKNRLAEFFRFLIVGIIATMIHYGIYLLLVNYINTSLAYSAGYLCSFVLNFYLSLTLTFKVKGSLKKIVGFAISHLINYLLHIILLNIFLNIHISPNYAPIPVFGIAIPVNFFLVRYFLKSKRFN